MSVETQWREQLLRRRRLVWVGWGLTAAMLVGALGMALLGGAGGA